MQGEEKQSSCMAWSGEGKALTPSTEISNQLALSLLNLTSTHTGFWKCLYSPALSLTKASAAPLAHNTGSQGPQDCSLAAAGAMQQEAAAWLSPPWQRGVTVAVTHAPASLTEPHRPGKSSEGPHLCPSAPWKKNSRMFAMD